MVVVHPQGLSEALCDEAGFVACNGAAGIPLEVIGPSAPHDIGIGGCVYYCQCLLLYELTDIPPYPLMPVGPIRAVVSLSLIVGLGACWDGDDQCMFT